MPKLERDIIVVIGRTGMGKTVWTRGYLRGQKRVIILDPQSEYPYMEFDTAKELISYIYERKIFRVKCCDLQEFGMLCFGASIVPKSLFVIEESQRVLAPRVKLPVEFEDLVYRGRHSETSLLLVAQRATTIDIAIRSQFSHLIVFRQTEKNDVQWITDSTGEDMSEIVPSLDRLEYLHITNTDIQRKKLTSFY